MSNIKNTIKTALLHYLYGKDEIFSRFGRHDVTHEEITNYIETLKLSWPVDTIKIDYNKENMDWLIKECKQLGSFTIAWQIHEHSLIIRAEKLSDLAYIRLKYSV